MLVVGVLFSLFSARVVWKFSLVVGAAISSVLRSGELDVMRWFFLILVLDEGSV